jgi:hypothetical protein
MIDKLFKFLASVLNGTAPYECAIWIWMILATIAFGLISKFLCSLKK